MKYSKLSYSPPQTSNFCYLMVILYSSGTLMVIRLDLQFLVIMLHFPQMALSLLQQIGKLLLLETLALLSCPHFCTHLRLETHHTGYLWAPLYPSESTHPLMTFSKTSLSSLNGPLPCSKPTRLLFPQTLKTPTHPQLRTLTLVSFKSL